MTHYARAGEISPDLHALKGGALNSAYATRLRNVALTATTLSLSVTETNLQGSKMHFTRRKTCKPTKTMVTGPAYIPGVPVNEDSVVCSVGCSEVTQRADSLITRHAVPAARRLHVTGRIIDAETCAPVEDIEGAILEAWQPLADGSYDMVGSRATRAIYGSNT